MKKKVIIIGGIVLVSVIALVALKPFLNKDFPY